MKTIPGIVVCGLCLALCSACESKDRQHPQADAAKPRLVFDTKDIDLGMCDAKKEIVAEFKLRNAGGGELKIALQATSCACAAAVFDKEYAPGAQGYVRIMVDPADRIGPLQTMAVLKTNDPLSPQIMLRVNAVIRGSTITPYALPLGTVVGGQDKSADVVIRRYGMDDVAKPLLRTADPALSVTLVDPPSTGTAPRDGQVFTYKVRLTTAPLPIGMFQGRLDADLGQPTGARTIPVSAEVLGRVKSAPATINFGILIPGERSRRTCTIVADEGAVVDVRRLDAKSITQAGALPPPSSKVTVQLDYTAPQHDGVITGEVMVLAYVNGRAESLRVPYTALVKGN